MNSKLRKQFLPSDYVMNFYEPFHDFEKTVLRVENTLSIGLRHAIRNEIEINHPTYLNDAYQYV